MSLVKMKTYVKNKRMFLREFKILEASSFLFEKTETEKYPEKGTLKSYFVYKKSYHWL